METTTLQMLIRLTTSAMMLALAVLPGNADPIADFYKGKTIGMIVGGSAGGGYDVLGRTIGQFIGRHIPGNPSVVARNMPGAGGMLAMNYLFNTAEKDGTVIGVVQSNTPLEPLFGTKEARYDAAKFAWLGTPSVEIAVVLVWHTVPVYSVDDLKAKETTMGVSGTQSTQAFLGRLMNATIGTKMKLVHGYKGLNDTFLAMERGELDGYPGVYYSALSSTRPNWLPDKLARAILQIGPDMQPELANVPAALDFVSNPEDRQLMQAAVATQALGRPLVMTPGVPADRVAAMRKALAMTFVDPDFQAVAKKIGLVVNAPRTGQQLQDIITQAYASPPGVVDRLRKLSNPGDQ
jgi:tripartite-type tricarboxylate transporter receptor subunit TctC